MVNTGQVNVCMGNHHSLLYGDHQPGECVGVTVRHAVFCTMRSLLCGHAWGTTAISGQQSSGQINVSAGLLDSNTWPD